MSLSLRTRLERPGFTLDVDLELPARGLTVLFGPSGCGKTTLLRCVAGLEPGARGRVAVGDTVWQDDAAGRREPPHRRRLGYVFQDGALFPHLTVAGNLDYARRRCRSVPAPDRDAIAARLGLGGLLTRRVDGLSGGERQRTALARALLTGGDLLLLDEPLAALDRDGRRALYPYLEQVKAALTGPALYVTHSLEEAARLADHLVLLEGGRAVLSGPLARVLTDPPPGLARGDDAGALIEAQVTGRQEDYQLTRLAFGGGELLLPAPATAPGPTVRLRIQARDVSLALERPAASSILNILPATVLEVLDDGPGRKLVRLDLSGTVLLAAVTARSAATLALAPGRRVHAQIKSVALL